MENKVNESLLEGRNPVIEALRAGKPIDKLYILDGANDGPIMTIKREAKKRDIYIKYVAKDRLDKMSVTGTHQGVIAVSAAYEYSDMEDKLATIEELILFASLYTGFSRNLIIGYL